MRLRLNLALLFALFCCLPLFIGGPIESKSDDDEEKKEEITRNDVRKALAEYVKPDTTDDRREELLKSIEGGDPAHAYAGIKKGVKDETKRDKLVEFAARYKVPGLLSTFRTLIDVETCTQNIVDLFFEIDEPSACSFLVRKHWEPVEMGKGKFQYITRGMLHHYVDAEICVDLRKALTSDDKAEIPMWNGSSWNDEEITRAEIARRVIEFQVGEKAATPEEMSDRMKEVKKIIIGGSKKYGNYAHGEFLRHEYATKGDLRFLGPNPLFMGGSYSQTKFPDGLDGEGFDVKFNILMVDPNAKAKITLTGAAGTIYFDVEVQDEKVVVYSGPTPIGRYRHKNTFKMMKWFELRFVGEDIKVQRKGMRGPDPNNGRTVRAYVKKPGGLLINFKEITGFNITSTGEGRFIVSNPSGMIVPTKIIKG